MKKERKKKKPVRVTRNVYCYTNEILRKNVQYIPRTEYIIHVLKPSCSNSNGINTLTLEYTSKFHFAFLTSKFTYETIVGLIDKFIFSLTIESSQEPFALRGAPLSLSVCASMFIQGRS